ncbi:Metallo-dependent phosphatase-like protein [Infundibulicybe gibba]|nr:Metallo-dependent phosphatase-like protein [Infundibulicybe gibba]
MLIRGRALVQILRGIWAIVIVWYELGVFVSSARTCQWPGLNLPSTELPASITPAHILIVADPQILDKNSYPGRAVILTYISQLIVDLNIRKNWRAALLKKPDAVVFLGDMMDGGRNLMSDLEYEKYHQRFKRIFAIDPAVPLYFIPGNHDVGLRSSAVFSPDARDRYASHFGKSNYEVHLADHSLVFLDGPGVVEEDYQRTGRGHSYAEWRPVQGGPIGFIRTMAKKNHTEPRVLFSHIPLFRPDGSYCGPLRESGTIRPGVGIGYQNTLGKSTTTFLLQQLQPDVAFSGDDHDYCEYVHLGPGGTPVREISVKSLSMAMGIRRPGFQLLSLAPRKLWPTLTNGKTYQETPCFLPDQIGIYLSVYIPLLFISLCIILISHTIRICTTRSPIDTSKTIRSPRNSEDKEHENSRAYSLPPPASHRTYRPPHDPLSAQSTLIGCLCFIPRRGRYQTLAAGFLRDVRDVAIFPLVIFAFITWRVSAAGS